MNVFSGVMALFVDFFDILGFIERYRILAWAALTPATLFPILYAKWFPFWKSTLGRALFTKACGLLLLVDTAVIFYLFPGIDPEIKKFVGFVTGVLVVLGMWWQLIAISKIRVADRMVYEASKIDDSHRTAQYRDRHTL